MMEEKGKLEKKLDIQSYESGNNFETIMKNHGEGLNIISIVNNNLVNSERTDSKINQMKVMLDQNYEKHIKVNHTLVENFESLIENQGKTYLTLKPEVYLFKKK